MSDPIECLSDASQGPRIYMVYRASLARTILADSRFQQAQFLAPILSLCDEESTRQIRFFIDSNPAFLNADRHAAQVEAIQQPFARCEDAIRNLNISVLLEAIDPLLDGSDDLTAHQVGIALVGRLMRHCLETISGVDPPLDNKEVFAVDIFQPFAKRSHLVRCNTILDALINAIENHPDRQCPLSDADRLAVLTLLMMGATPLLAVATALLNAVIRSPDSADLQASLASLSNGYSMLPTNFVMRECVVPHHISGHSLHSGDTCYLFLGDVSGCPFSSSLKLPLGYGSHYCKGAGLAKVVTARIQELLLYRANEIAENVCTSAVQVGPASAFLKYSDASLSGVASDLVINAQPH
ncbi:cytochrome P450 [Synechococcus sp. CS-1332]|uniref:cytochrome P450 n=1 Tax=Synechococcus sp. CS-1332 TaxID=2847972 RepID=UPI00223BD02E|nr:cytochrome P450 [Synechococcus sp. CS-1332]MCT0208715.1 cytochrome P450 [Synechococcus sp. CS-1332]